MANQKIASLPIIDYAKLIGPATSDTSDALKVSVAEKAKLYGAFAEVGFIFLANHAVPELAEQNLFAHARKFFSLPESEKAKVETSESKGFRGWFSPARTSGNTTTSDQKETFDVGNDADEKRPNQWPEDWPELRETMNLFFDKCCEVQLVLLRALAEHIGIAGDYFEPRMASKDHFFRIIYYPERTRDSSNTRYRATPHTDYGTLTLLFNDKEGGLQVKSPEGAWVDVEPIPGCCIVNGKIPIKGEIP
jgi:isopenicillin N synthase-like dioxygenase